MPSQESMQAKSQKCCDKPEFPGGADLFNPPEDLYGKTDRFQPPNPDIRAQTMYLLNNDKPALEKSLRTWIHALYNQAPKPDKLSTKRLNHLVYSMRGLKLREFITLAKATDFSSALFHLTGLRLGTARDTTRASQQSKSKSGGDGEDQPNPASSSVKKGKKGKSGPNFGSKNEGKGKFAHTTKFLQETGQSLTEKPTANKLDAEPSTQTGPNVTRTGAETPWQITTDEKPSQIHSTSTFITTESQHVITPPRPHTHPAPCDQNELNNDDESNQKTKNHLDTTTCNPVSSLKNVGLSELEPSTGPQGPKISRGTYLRQPIRYHSRWTPHHPSPQPEHKRPQAPRPTPNNMRWSLPQPMCNPLPLIRSAPNQEKTDQQRTTEQVEQRRETGALSATERVSVTKWRERPPTPSADAETGSNWHPTVPAQPTQGSAEHGPGGRRHAQHDELPERANQSCDADITDCVLGIQRITKLPEPSSVEPQAMTHPTPNMPAGRPTEDHHQVSSREPVSHVTVRCSQFSQDFTEDCTGMRRKQVTKAPHMTVQDKEAEGSTQTHTWVEQEEQTATTDMSRTEAESNEHQSRREDQVREQHEQNQRTDDMNEPTTRAPSTNTPLTDDMQREAIQRPVYQEGSLSTPVTEMIEALRRPISLEDMSLLYGVDLAALKKTSKEAMNPHEKQLAATELANLKAIRRYLSDQRGKIRNNGTNFLISLTRIPGKTLTVENKRFETLERQGKRKAYNYTDRRRGVVYRCSLPGCAGGIINMGCIRNALQTHCNIYHKVKGISLTFKVEMARNWIICQYPAKTLKQHESKTLSSFQQITDEETNHQREDLFVDDAAPQPRPTDLGMLRDRDKTGNLRTSNVSTLRYSLLSGMEPESATSNMLYCATDTEEDVKGTGVHALKNYDRGQLGAVHEIGKQVHKKNAWEETIGTEIQQRKEKTHPQHSQRPPHSPELNAPIGADNMSTHMTSSAQEGQVELMEPKDFHESILNMEQPPRDPTHHSCP